MPQHNGLEFPWEGDSYHSATWQPKVIGKSTPIVDGFDHVTGKAQFSGDYYLPNMLHGKILFSKIAHANIKSIDTSKAVALPGVRAVITYKDRAEAATAPGNYNNWFLVDKVRRWGDPMAAVAADTEEIAENALDLIAVTYEELPVVLTYDDAAKTGAPLINEKLWAKNVAATAVKRERGDVTTGFTQADMIFENDYTLGNPSILPPELACTVASYESGSLTLWNKDQEIEGAIKQVAPVTGIPMANIRVIHPHGGGAYSSSNALGWTAPVAALLSMKTNRPVRLETDIEYATIQGGRAPLQLHLKVGVKKDGTITAIDAVGKDNASSLGWTSSESNFTPASTLNLYSCPNERYNLSFIATNISAVSQYRGYGAPQGWPIDAMMDEIAEKMGMDTLELRKKNFPKQWDPVLSFGAWVPQTSTGMVPLVDKLSTTLGWKAKWSPPAGKTGSVKTGIGLGAGCKDSAMGAANLIARLDPDGAVNVFVDAADCGQSIHTFIPQVFAELLDIPLEKVKIYWGDSAFTPRSGQDVSSRFAMCGGNAARRTVDNLLAILFQKAAVTLKTTVDDLEVKNGAVQVKGKPETAIPYGTLVGAGSMITVGGDSGLTMSFRGKCSMMMQYASACEAQVDTETGGVNITRWLVGGDVGRAINPSIVEGQLSGAGYSMIGETLTNEVVYDPTTGVPLNTSHEDCRYPTAADIPPTTVIYVESIDPFNAFGQKGVGETSMTSQVPTIINTIANATGVRIRQTPITPEVLLKALGKI